ncbi:MAG: MFS transporter [Bdellovibrionaceae bacterium]|nr:MFS transporter [Pseudobdellovibrionaceae bacterium]
MAGFFPVFFKSYWIQGFSSVESTATLGTTIGISSLLIAIISPTLGAVSDLKNLKKKLLIFFMVIGILSCFGLSLLSSGQWLAATVLYGISMMAFNASCTFYDSLLPYVASEEETDFISALGYSLGYLGGGVLFLLNVLMYLFPARFGFENGVQAVKFSFFSVSLWWFVFSLPLMYFVKEPQGKVSERFNLVKLTHQSYLMLKATLKDILQNKNLFYFMLAFWLYIDGVYTVISMAVDYGISLNFEAKDLIAALLITQFVGFPSTFFFGVIAKRWGCKIPIILCIGIYSVTIVLATQMSKPIHFYILAMIIGLAQGGVQSLSRSLFAKMIPKEKSGEYFGFMNLIGKFASILGPFIVALTVTLTGKSNLGLMGLLVLFILGVFFLLKVKSE